MRIGSDIGGIKMILKISVFILINILGIVLSSTQVGMIMKGINPDGAIVFGFILLCIGGFLSFQKHYLNQFKQTCQLFNSNLYHIGLFSILTLSSNVMYFGFFSLVNLPNHFISLIIFLLGVLALRKSWILFFEKDSAKTPT